MEKIRRIPLIVTIIAGIWLFYSEIRKQDLSESETQSDTIVVRDTIRVSVPVVRDSTIVRYVRVPVVRDSLRVDTLLELDTAYIEMPIMQKYYTDSTYTAWVSGYDPRLDSIHVYPRHEVITTTIRPKPRRWGVGVLGGVGITPKGLQPYIGIGVSYNLLAF